MASDTGARADAILAVLDLCVEDVALAETRLRRLANRHGHRSRIAYPGGLTWDICPDPEAHVRDVEAMSDALKAAGLAPYESAGKLDMWGMRRKTAGSEEGT